MSFSTQVLANNPYSWYRCNETSGATLVDASGNSRNGTILGTVSYQQTGFSIDGNHSELVATNAAGGFKLNGGPGVTASAFTLGFWWKPGSTLANTYIASGVGTIASVNVGWDLQENVAGTSIQLLVSDASGNFNAYNTQPFYQASNSSQNISANGPAQFYWVTYDGIGSWNIYIGGNSGQAIIVSSAPLVVPTTSPSLGVASISGGTVNCAAGNYQDILTFPVVLTAAQRQAIYSSAVPVAGGFISSTDGSSGVTLTTSQASALNYSIYRGTDPNFTANSGSLLATVGSMPYTDTTGSPGVEYFYGLIADDGAGNFSPSLPVGLTTVGSIPLQYVAGRKFSLPPISVVFIGDSITWGAGVPNLGTMLSPTAPFFTAYRLSTVTGRAVNAFNNGANGTTTSDWQPGGTLYNGAAQASKPSSSASILMAANPSSKLIFNIMLGTNDSSSSISNGGLNRALTPAEYATKLTAILNQLLNVDWRNSIAIVHYNKWYSPNTNNAAVYLQSGLSNLVSYNNIIPSVISAFPGRAYVGDTRSFDYFSQNYTSEIQAESGVYGNFYLHPSGSVGSNGHIGTQSLGELWASAINSVITSGSGGGGGSSGPTPFFPSPTNF